MTDVFISWSGDRSKEIAEALRKWIPSVLQFAKPYYTPSDIEKGAKWSSEIAKKLSESKIGIVCLTEDNYQKPWILFEAGALSKDLKDSRVCSVLFGMDNTDLTGPLATLQTTQFDKADFRNMMLTINETGADRALSRETFDTVFDKWWPELKSQVEAILSKEKKQLKGDIRSDRDILEEILLLSRTASRASKHGETDIIQIGLIEDLIDTCQASLGIYSTDADFGGTVEKLIRATRYLVSRSLRMRELFEVKVDALQEEFDDIVPF